MLRKKVRKHVHPAAERALDSASATRSVRKTYWRASAESAALSESSLCAVPAPASQFSRRWRSASERSASQRRSTCDDARSAAERPGKALATKRSSARRGASRARCALDGGAAARALAQQRVRNATVSAQSSSARVATSAPSPK